MSVENNTLNETETIQNWINNHKYSILFEEILKRGKWCVSCVDTILCKLKSCH